MLLKAFSLIEVLVVASILAILSAVAIPAYKTYKTRVAITNVHNYLQGLAQQLATKYQQTGSWPASIDFAGTTVTSGNTAPGSCTENVPIANLAVCQISYLPKSSANNDSDKATVLLQGMLSPSLNFGATNVFRVAVSINTTKNQILFPCGIWNGAANNMPTAYLPSACTCIYMQDYQGGGPVPLRCG